MLNFSSLILNGLSIGMAFFLAASGLTILFGVLRILNFAHGSFIMIGAYLAATILGHAGKYGVMEFLVTAVVVGGLVGLLGLIVDRLVFRRLHGVDEAVALIATYSLMLVANGVAELIWGAHFASVDPPRGLEGGIALGPLFVPSFSVFLVAIGLVAFVLIEIFLHRSWLGKTLRAIAEDHWIMSIMGHSSRRLELFAVFLAFFLAGFAGSLLVPNQMLTPSVGNQFIIQAFAVVIVGGIGSVRGAFLASMLLGLAESVGSVVMPSLALYVCMIVILILRPQGLIPPPQASAPGSWSFAWLWQGLSPVKLPASFVQRTMPARTLSAAAAVPPADIAPGVSASYIGGVLVLALVFLSLPLWAGEGIIFVASLLLIAAVFAMSWNFMFGFSGIAVFGHAAFFAVGAYLSAYALKHAPDVSFLLVLLAAFGVAGLLAMVVGIIAVRRATGVQLAILTLALAEVLRVVISYSASFGRDEGLSAIPRPQIGIGVVSIQLTADRDYFLFLCAACGLMGWIIWLISYSDFGRTLRSIRQDSQRALFLGINVDRFRLISFILAAAIAAFAGALAAPLTQIVTPEVASIARSTGPMLHTLVGGAGTFWGPALGAAVFSLIEYSTRTLAGLSELIMGITLLVIVLIAPGGVFGFLRSLGTRLVERRRAPRGAVVRDVP